MNVSAVEIAMATAGGAVIGIASVLLLWLNGRIAGISGILSGLFTRNAAERGWRISFVAGLILGGFLFQNATGEPLIARTDFPIALTLVAGGLVGFGTRHGSGCTSGHGICGIARLSVRSLTATVVFVAVGMATATLRFWLGGQ